MTTSQITRPQAEAALAAVKQRYAAYMQPVVLDSFTIPGLPEPVLEQIEGTWMISWEDGPSEWAYRASMGGSSEEDRALFAAASQEFGTEMKPSEETPVTWPKGVHAEPYFSFVLGLYPA